MIENINDFLSIFILVAFFAYILLSFFNYLNGKRIKKHIEDEYFYYADFESNETSE